MICWLDEQPEAPRPLTLPELRRLHKLGFPELAERLAAGRCPECGLNRLSSTHKATCDVERPLDAPEASRQPWQLRDAA